MRKQKSTKPEKKPGKEGQVNAVVMWECGEKGFDFGGLPPRDLKKNLGCG